MSGNKKEVKTEIRARLGIGPVSAETVEAVYRYSNFRRKEIMLIPSKNQVDYGGGYVECWTTKKYKEKLDSLRKKYEYSNVRLCRDHCGPGFIRII